MEYAIIIILVALLQYIFFTGRTGFTRLKYEVPAPKISGNETWERIYRVQQNTMEQLIIFIPSMLIFSHYVSDTWVMLPGVIFLVGRQIFSHFYITNPDKRAPGMVMSLFSNVALVIGSLIGVGLQLCAM
jgi:glutathione S-transferase